MLITFRWLTGTQCFQESVTNAEDQESLKQKLEGTLLRGQFISLLMLRNQKHQIRELSLHLKEIEKQ